jgi:hypothetical protein
VCEVWWVCACALVGHMHSHILHYATYTHTYTTAMEGGGGEDPCLNVGGACSVTWPVTQKAGWLVRWLQDNTLFVCANGNVCIVRGLGGVRVRTVQSQMTILVKAHHTIIAIMTVSRQIHLAFISLPWAVKSQVISSFLYTFNLVV